MNRRGALSMLGGTLVLGGTLGARAQPAIKVRRIGMLFHGDSSPSDEIQLWAAVRALGWIEGHNLLVENRYARGKLELLRSYAEELVGLNVEIIGTFGNDATFAAKNATTRIPIVMIMAAESVGAGLVASLARPGGNVTGFSYPYVELDAKRMALLRELLPTAQRVGVLADPSNPHTNVLREDRERALRSLGMEPITVEIAAASELENAVAEVSRRGAQALTILASSRLFYLNRVLIARGASAYARDDWFLERLCGGWWLVVARSGQRGERSHLRVLCIDRCWSRFECPIEIRPGASSRHRAEETKMGVSICPKDI